MGEEAGEWTRVREYTTHQASEHGRERERATARIRAREIRILTVFIELGNFIYGYFIEFAR